MSNWKAGFVCALIAFVLVLVTLFGAWYTMSGEGSAMGVTAKMTTDMGLRESTLTTEADGVKNTTTTSYSDMPESSSIKVFNLTQILVVLALIFTLLMFVFALLVGMGKLSSKIGTVIGALAIVFTLITFVYFMAALPAAMEEEATPEMPVKGFWGSESMDFMGISMELKWGPGWAWYLMIVAFILALIGTIMLIGAGPAPPEAVPMEYMEEAPPPEAQFMEEVAPPVEEPLEPPAEGPPASP